MNLISLFSGAGGLDLGFEKAGFKILWANEYDKTIWKTYRENHLTTELDTRSIRDVNTDEIILRYGEIDGIIGGPPCQSWSLAGSMRGILDERGQLVLEYLRFINDIKPTFFLFENVPGLVSRTHFPEFLNLVNEFRKLGYVVNYSTLDASDYGVSQIRKRVFIVGIRSDLNKEFDFQSIEKSQKKYTLNDSIKDLAKSATPSENNRKRDKLSVPNHEYFIGDYSSIYMSRNRRKNWDEQSFTIQASGRHAPLHPDSSKMIKIDTDKMEFFDKGNETRRLTVRECARIQGFPDNFIFYYNRLDDGYKMVGNAVPVKLVQAIATELLKVFKS
jgi:DNA (cytosine-5)-methyltransferase 1